MTDKELLGYADIHCETELALFSTAHLERLIKLAGDEVPDFLYRRGFWSAGREVVKPLVEKGRRRLEG